MPWKHLYWLGHITINFETTIFGLKHYKFTLTFNSHLIHLGIINFENNFRNLKWRFKLKFIFSDEKLCPQVNNESLLMMLPSWEWCFQVESDAYKKRQVNSPSEPEEFIITLASSPLPVCHLSMHSRMPIYRKHRQQLLYLLRIGDVSKFWLCPSGRSWDEEIIPFSNINCILYCKFQSRKTFTRNKLIIIITSKYW